MKDVYIIATEAPQPVDSDALAQALDSDALVFTGNEEGWGFRLKADSGEVDVRFEAREAPLGWTPDLLTGAPESVESLRRARGFYRIAFDTSPPFAPLTVIEALGCARAILSLQAGVLLDITAFKVHDAQDVEDIVELDLDIRDHINLHVQQVTEGSTPLWVHTHGMEKFGCRNVEMFHLAEEDLPAAETFLNELCTDLARGSGPDVRELVETSLGDTFQLQPSEEARTRLMGVSLDVFEGHEGPFLTVVSAEGRHTTSEVLRPFRERLAEEDPARSEALRSLTTSLLPGFKARFLRKGLMEPLTFLVRAPFESHPDGETVTENLWVEVLAWEEDRLVGRLIEGSDHTTEWRRGAVVEVEEEQVNALVLTHEGRPLEEEEMRAMLEIERPS